MADASSWLKEKRGPSPCFTDDDVELLWAELQALREAMTGWEGYAHKQGEYVDDIGEYFAALLEKNDATRE